MIPSEATHYFKTFPARLKDGRMLCDLDAECFKQVCLLGHPLPKEVARGRDLMRLNLTIGGIAFQVVGIVALESAVIEQAKLSDSSARLDIYVPYQTAIQRYGTRSFKYDQGQKEFFKIEIDQAVLDLEDPMSSAPAIKTILKKDHTKEDYEITVPMEMLRQKQRTQDIFNLVMIFISSLTLLVGGIGIVNSMLISVAERTKEIGIRRALGARRRDIMFQFIVETVALTLIGGILGCAAGAGGVLAIAHYTGWSVIITPVALIMSILASTGAGILFGLYPARKAARINPVFALRYE